MDRDPVEQVIRQSRGLAVVSLVLGWICAILMAPRGQWTMLMTQCLATGYVVAFLRASKRLVP